jgi:hypothetical protein
MCSTDEGTTLWQVDIPTTKRKQIVKADNTEGTMKAHHRVMK